MFDEEISTSRSLFDYDISILSVWLNHLTVPKVIKSIISTIENSKNTNQRKEEKKMKPKKLKNIKIEHNKKHNKGEHVSFFFPALRRI